MCRTHLPVLGGQLLIGDVQLKGLDGLIAVELRKQVGVEGLALADGGVHRYDNHCVRGLALGQDEQACDCIILDAEILRLRSASQGPLIMLGFALAAMCPCCWEKARA